MSMRYRSHHLFQLIYLPLLFAGTAAASCLEIFPETQVATRLAKPEYTACEVSTMLKDYSKLLGEQGMLLEMLIPAYKRNFTDTEELTDKLNGYLSELHKLTTVSSEILTQSELLDDASGDESDNVALPHADLSELLSEGQQSVQSLISKAMLTINE